MAAKKPTPTRTAKPVSKVAREATPIASTAVRNSAIPKPQPAAPAPKVITYEMIAKRAYEISQSPECGSEFDNWCRAERELNGR